MFSTLFYLKKLLIKTPKTSNGKQILIRRRWLSLLSKKNISRLTPVHCAFYAWICAKHCSPTILISMTIRQNQCDTLKMLSPLKSNFRWHWNFVIHHLNIYLNLSVTKKKHCLDEMKYWISCLKIYPFTENDWIFIIFTPATIKQRKEKLKVFDMVSNFEIRCWL